MQQLHHPYINQNQKAHTKSNPIKQDKANPLHQLPFPAAAALVGVATGVGVLLPPPINGLIGAISGSSGSRFALVVSMLTLGLCLLLRWEV